MARPNTRAGRAGGEWEGLEPELGRVWTLIRLGLCQSSALSEWRPRGGAGPAVEAGAGRLAPPAEGGGGSGPRGYLCARQSRAKAWPFLCPRRVADVFTNPVASSEGFTLKKWYKYNRQCQGNGLPTSENQGFSSLRARPLLLNPAGPQSRPGQTSLASRHPRPQQGCESRVRPARPGARRGGVVQRQGPGGEHWGLPVLLQDGLHLHLGLSLPGAWGAARRGASPTPPLPLPCP